MRIRVNNRQNAVGGICSKVGDVIGPTDAPYNLPGDWQLVAFEDGSWLPVRMDGPGFAVGPPVIEVLEEYVQTSLMEVA